ncbi:MAG: DUF137 domain-containing protein, partial [Nitrosarchaeum sp.]|nr:DUF137 domain-containing protein [Nitrosarchaeum sp.]
PLEDGDRTKALRDVGKKVITFDLNPMSRTSQTANITIVDNVTRSTQLLIDYCKKMSKQKKSVLEKTVKEFNNKGNLSKSIIEMRNNLTRRAYLA